MCSLIFIITGCGSTHFIILRDVPLSPTFVVLPANAFLSEVTYANRVENILISSGVSVVSRPSFLPTKHVKTERVLEEDDKNTDSTTHTERYFEYEKLNADYIVQTYATAGQIKITKRETQEILTIFTVSIYSLVTPEWREHVFKPGLRNMGIPVTK